MGSSGSADGHSKTISRELLNQHRESAQGEGQRDAAPLFVCMSGEAMIMRVDILGLWSCVCKMKPFRDGVAALVGGVGLNEPHHR